MSRTQNGAQLAGADALIQSLDWLAGQNVRIVNISLAGPYNKILEIAVDEAAARGLILVASVGNFGSNAGPFYPAAFDNVIAATAVDANVTFTIAQSKVPLLISPHPASTFMSPRTLAGGL